MLVEGGATLLSALLVGGALDRLHALVAPLIIGSGRPAFALPPIDRLEEAIRPPATVARLGQDMLVDMDLRAGRVAPPSADR